MNSWIKGGLIGIAIAITLFITILTSRIIDFDIKTAIDPTYIAYTIIVLISTTILGFIIGAITGKLTEIYIKTKKENKKT